MHYSVKNLIDLKKEIEKKIIDLNIDNYKPTIIAVSKTFPIEKIEPLIKHGHTDFGENKVQEAITKWTHIKEQDPKIKLHMIGKLQTNKVKNAVKLFDYIHSVDSIKLADKISSEQSKINKNIKLFLQINIGDESQKSGVHIQKISELYMKCIELKLDVMGLMCIPPLNGNIIDYFSKIKVKNDELNLNHLSLGMSGDYTEALKVRSNYIRIGTKIFGQRN